MHEHNLITKTLQCQQNSLVSHNSIAICPSSAHISDYTKHGCLLDTGLLISNCCNKVGAAYTLTLDVPDHDAL